MIGQRFIEMLEDHPYFEMEGLYASERSEGKRLGDVLKVRDHVYKDETLDRRIEAMDLDKISKNCRNIFGMFGVEVPNEPVLGIEVCDLRCLATPKG